MKDLNEIKRIRQELFFEEDIDGVEWDAPISSMLICGSETSHQFMYKLIARTTEQDPDKVRLWFLNLGAKNTNPFDQDTTRMIPHIERTSLQCKDIEWTLSEWEELINDKISGKCDDDQIHLLFIDNFDEAADCIKNKISDLLWRIKDKAEEANCYTIVYASSYHSLHVGYVVRVNKRLIEVGHNSGIIWFLNPITAEETLRRVNETMSMTREEAAKICRISPYVGRVTLRIANGAPIENDVEAYQE